MKFINPPRCTPRQEIKRATESSFFFQCDGKKNFILFNNRVKRRNNNAVQFLSKLSRRADSFIISDLTLLRRSCALVQLVRDLTQWL